MSTNATYHYYGKNYREIDQPLTLAKAAAADHSSLVSDKVERTVMAKIRGEWLVAAIVVAQSGQVTDVQIWPQA